MKKVVSIIVALLFSLTFLNAKSHIGINISPYFDGGSISWIHTSGRNESENLTYDVKHFVFGTEIDLDLGFYKTWGRHSVGGEFGLGIAMPIISMANGEKAIPLYDIALLPYVAAAYSFNFSDDFAISFALGLESTIGYLDEEMDNGNTVKGNAIDIVKYFARLSVMYNFTPSWALRAGVDATLTPFIIPEIYRKEIYDESERELDVDSSALAIIYHIEPFIGASFTF